MAANGVEAGQSKAVIIPFDNQDAALNNLDGSFFVNTYMNKNKVAGDLITVNINFASPVPQENLQVSAFNPFLISNLRRGYEIHLPGYLPTDKADTKLFATNDDASVPASGKYYISKQNWPWLLPIPVSLATLSNCRPSTQLTFTSRSGLPPAVLLIPIGYSNTGTSYRDATKIYSK